MPKGRPFRTGRKKTGGRRPGVGNRWTKANIEQMRKHAEAVLDEHPGGIERWLATMALRHPIAFMGLLRDLTPKPAQKIEAGGKIVLSWKGE